MVRCLVPILVLALEACSLRDDPPLAAPGGNGNTGADGSGGAALGGSGGADAGGAGNAGGAPPECDAELTTDPDNCGACGHACIDSPCNDGECDAQVKFPPLVGLIIWDLAFDDDFVWASVTAAESGLWRLDTPAGPGNWGSPVPVTALDSLARGITDTPTEVFAATSTQRFRIAKDGTGTFPIATALGNDKHLAFNGTFVFETNTAGTLISYAGDSPSVLLESSEAPELLNAWAVVATPEFVFWTQRRTAGGVHRWSPAQDVETLLADSGAPTDIALLGETLFWTDCAGGKIYRHSTDGNERAEVVVDMPGAHPYALEADGDFLYWYDLDASESQHCLVDDVARGPVGRIWRSRISTPQNIVLKSEVGTTEAFRLHGDYLFWCDIEGASTTCRRIAK